MEPLNQLKRRSTDLLKQAQQNMPSMPEMPNMSNMPNMPNMSALPGLPKSINIPNISKKLPSLPQFRQTRSPDDAVQATWERLEIPSLPRSSHSLNVVAGCAYIFGGELEGQQPVDNGMHVIRLPFSSAGADYYTVTAKASLHHPTSEQSDQRSEQALSQAAQASLEEVPLRDTSEDTASEDKGKEIAKDQKPELDDIPCPRAGHATAVIGSRIFLFGGRGGPNMEPLEEAGRVWAYDTRSHTWSHLDPVPAVKGGAIIPHPAPRSNHCATASDRPRDFPNLASSASTRSAKPQTWRQWAIGDTSKTGIPQDPVVGYVAETAVDEDSAGYGTFFVHAGCLASGDLTSDLWAFDVRTRTWTELPAAPGPVRSGSAMCISKSRLYRFGGWDGESELGGQLDVLHLEVETFDDGHSKGEVAVQARAGWQSILQDGTGDASSTSEIHAEPSTRQKWPAPRGEASLQALTLGGGREYLVLCMGGHDTFFSDVWTFQVPPRGMTPASFTAAVYQVMGRRTGEGKWEKLRTGPYDEENTGGDGVPVGRGWLASAPMTDLEESGIVIWGGLGGNEQRMGDGWILRLGQ
ncbi:hypothetical protein E4U60_006868 [Claviceps pazoutovae]|uniref:Uncharacterized protein n=1 Tax=Claviceps pazoutovae TaxID=1649127 RepID=A0A9P7MKM6_9HYPO|nr:hypothetical protein E4U60_006868 [Claviceps pazoutovae]